MTRVYEVTVEYAWDNRTKNVHAHFVDRDLPSLMERLGLSHPEAYSITITDKGMAQ